MKNAAIQTRINATESPKSPWQIVEYNPSLAAEIANMWKRSNSGWNGRVFSTSASKVQQEEGNGGYLHLYLAVVESQVVGYAKLAEYMMEKGVADVELLNVDPLWHGKGVGRDLMLKCVLRATELGFQRLDLFTWAGNTKAVPLYKKCGFFWEKMDSQNTHLMNFLPGLMNNELLKPYFDDFHWYEDQVRDLSVEPDGRDENGFDIYDYLWEKDGKQLAISIERLGRGIVSIRTPDFEISTHIGNPKPVFGSSYDFDYELDVKGLIRINVSLGGRDDLNVLHKLDQSFKLKGKTLCYSRFHLNPIQEEITEWKTNPGVITTFSLDDKSVELKCGLKIQYPLDLEMRASESLCFPGREQTVYLNLRNNFAVACDYRIELEETELVKLKERSLRIRLQAGEASYLPLYLTASQGNIFEPNIKVHAKPEGLPELDYTKLVTHIMHSPQGRDQKLTHDYILLMNGLSLVSFNRNIYTNWGSFGVYYSQGFGLQPCLIGKPYSEEFLSSPPVEYEFNEIGQANQLVCKYRSKEIPGLEFARVYKLYPSGVMEYSIRILQVPETENEIWIKQKVTLQQSDLSFANNGRIIHLEYDLPDLGMGELPVDAIGENWVFSRYEQSCFGVVWDPSHSALIEEWGIVWEHNLSALKASGCLETAPLIFFVDVFKNAYQLRDYATKKLRPSQPQYPSMELVVNQANPFVGNEFEASLVQHLDTGLRGDFSLSSPSLKAQIQSYNLLEDIREIKWQLQPVAPEAVEIISCEASIPTTIAQRKQLIFSPRGEIKEHKQRARHTVDNGILSFSAAEDARLPGLISLQYQGQEWLDKSYPDYGPKSSYNPFPGGIGINPAFVRMSAFFLEEHKLKNALLRDQWGQLWKGLSFSSLITRNEIHKGLLFTQYYMTLPGLPLLAIFTQIEHGSGKAEYQGFHLGCFFHPEAPIQDWRMRVPAEKGGWQSYRINEEALHLQDSYRQIEVSQIGSPSRLNMLHMSKANYYIHMDPKLMRSRTQLWSEITIKDKQWLPPVFMIFTEEEIRQEWIYPLLELKVMSDE